MQPGSTWICYWELCPTKHIQVRSYIVLVYALTLDHLFSQRMITLIAYMYSLTTFVSAANTIQQPSLHVDGWSSR